MVQTNEYSHDALNQILEVAGAYTPNHKHAAIVDFRLDADKHRFFKVDLEAKKFTYSHYTSHGKNSGSLLRATEFSNVPGSLMSSLGIYKTAEQYYSSKFGRALRLDGLSPTNNHARDRAVVLHRAHYVDQSYIDIKRYSGRSEGCITLCHKDADWIMNDLAGGSIILSIYK